MREDILQLLPIASRRQVRAIEHAIGGEFEFRPPRADDPDYIKGSARPCLDCWPQQSAMRVSLVWPQGRPVTPHMVAHEVEHAHRKVVEGVWWLSSEEAADETVLTISNDIEHLHVVPAEIGRFPVAKEHWLDLYSHLVSELPELPGYVPQHARIAMWRAAMRHWVFASLVLPESALLTPLAKLLRHYERYEAAQLLVREMRGAPTDVQVRLMLDALESPVVKPVLLAYRVAPGQAPETLVRRI